MHGGGHQSGIRSGTLDVPGIVGMGAAAELMRGEGAEEAVRLANLRDQLQARLLAGLDDVVVNGSTARRHPGNLNVSFGYVDGAALLIAVCETVFGVERSRVQLRTTRAELRPSGDGRRRGVGKSLHPVSAWVVSTTLDEVARTGDAVLAAVDRLRAESPMWAARQRGETPDW